MLNIVFDATIFANAGYRNAGRSGIFFVAQNILREFMKREDVCVKLYFSPEKYVEGLVAYEQLFPNLELTQKMNHCLFLQKIHRFFWKMHLSLRKNVLESVVASVGVFLGRKMMPLLVRIDSRIFNEADCFFSPFSAIPDVFAKSDKMVRAVVLYDLIPFKLDEYRSARTKGWFGELVKNLRSDYTYFAISQSAKNDFCCQFPQLSSDKISVILLAANERLYKIKSLEALMFLRKKYGIPSKKYVFSLCTLEPRKNLIRMVNSFIQFVTRNAIEDMVFVIGGAARKNFEGLLKNSLDDPRLFDKYVVRIGYVDDDDLSSFYSNAEWFVYTSQYEGFGLPPLEAMQCGCPVITSNNSSLPEVVGDAGIMIDWDSDEQHVAAYEKYYFNDALREEYSRKGLERAKLFSWKKTVDLIVENIGEIHS